MTLTNQRDIEKKYKMHLDRTMIEVSYMVHLGSEDLYDEEIDYDENVGTMLDAIYTALRNDIQNMREPKEEFLENERVEQFIIEELYSIDLEDTMVAISRIVNLVYENISDDDIEYSDAFFTMMDDIGIALENDIQTMQEYQKIDTSFIS